ncbi:ATP-dependent nuclease [Pseudomonas sp. H3_G03]
MSLSETNILVGANNAGKSTIISAFRILDVAIRRARRLKSERIPLPDGGSGLGHRIPEQQISVSLENVATNYNGEDSRIEFRLTNKNKLYLFFPNDGGCILHWESDGPLITTTLKFKSAFPIVIQVVPVLGPLEHEETYVSEDTVKNALNTHRACRHFRNYWYYFREDWEKFSSMVTATWPSMSMSKPELDVGSKKLRMFVAEERIDREVYWAGFGFQIWCQLLTHLSRADEASIVVIDEPEIYLHPDIQRQLLSILRALDSDVLLATHSVEIMGEADPSEILLVSKGTRLARRLRDIEGVQFAVEELGSAQNITLSHLARTKKILFVEGMSDYKTIRRFAKNLGFSDLASGNDLTAFESGGFSSWEKIRSFAWGIKNTIDATMKLFAVYDRDYYCQEEIESILCGLRSELTAAHIHSRKEMENYLLVIPVLQRVLEKRVESRGRRAGEKIALTKGISDYIDEITAGLKIEAQSQYIARRLGYYQGKKEDASTISRTAIEKFEEMWADLNSRMQVVPGKTTLRLLRDAIQTEYNVNMTDVQIIDEFKVEEIPKDLQDLITNLDAFRKS